MEITSKQFNNLATRDDLNIVKDDLNIVKDDLKALEKKMDKKFNKVFIDSQLTKDNIKRLEEKMATKKDTDKILKAVDGFAKKVETVEQEQTANLGAHDRFEKRITKLEAKAVA